MTLTSWRAQPARFQDPTATSHPQDTRGAGPSIWAEKAAQTDSNVCEGSGVPRRQREAPSVAPTNRGGVCWGTQLARRAPTASTAA